jgi:hypothetical protein
MMHTRVVRELVGVAIAKHAKKTVFHILEAMSTEGKFVCGSGMQFPALGNGCQTELILGEVDVIFPRFFIKKIKLWEL